MEVWSSSVSNDSEPESNGSLGEEEEEEESGADRLCRELVEGKGTQGEGGARTGCRGTGLLCSERVGQVTKTYHDIEAVTHLLEEKERDLELAARIGQSLLKQNRALTEHNEFLDEQLQIAKEEIAQLRHELTMRDDLLHLYTSTEETEPASETSSPMRWNDSSSSLSNYVHYDFLQQKLKGLEEENRKLRSEATELSSETTNYEEQEQQLMMDCVEELSSANKRVVSLSDELARKVEDTLRQQEEISNLLAQIVDLQQRSKALATENEEVTQHLSASREAQSQLRLELKDLQDKYSECEDMLREAQEEVKNLRNKNLPNSTVNRYSTLAAVIPMDSLAAEIEGTMRKGLDSPAPAEYRNHPWRVFETVKAVNQAARLRSSCQSPQVPGSSPSSARSSHTSTPRTSYYGSDSASVTHEDKASAGGGVIPDEQSELEEKRLGQPGTPGGQDLEAALRRLSARQENHESERPFFEVERERKLQALAAQAEGEGSSGFLTPNDSILSTGTNYSGSSHNSSGSGLSSGSRSYLPDRLQIVKPLEGSVTLLHWQQLAQPNLGGILHPRPGVLTKDFRELEVDLQHSLGPAKTYPRPPPRTPSQPVGSCTPPSPTVSEGLGTSVFSSPDVGLAGQVRLPGVQHGLRPRVVSTCGSSEHLKPSPLFHLPTESSSDLRNRFRSSTSCFGLLRSLQEQGISASSRPTPPAAPRWNILPLRTQPTSHPGCSIPHTAEGGQPPGRSSNSSSSGKGNIFSFNLVGKLQSLGLDKVVARGVITPKTERKEQ
ncbi:hypothetical protein JZ751_008051 [Albula glossodonta]|uniref:Uncharacterized protein n=1 Tax=Albula glossodonta TaxID=121402 RepID=A0A8T2P3B3_9TELE|nr:hypothetical protein JZ751_008051 [Albula glossodonta]